MTAVLNTVHSITSWALTTNKKLPGIFHCNQGTKLQGFGFNIFSFFFHFWHSCNIFSFHRKKYTGTLHNSHFNMLAVCLLLEFNYSILIPKKRHCSRGLKLTITYNMFFFLKKRGLILVLYTILPISLY